MWSAAEKDVQEKWFFVAKLWDRLYVRDLQHHKWTRRILLPDGTVYNRTLDEQPTKDASDCPVCECFGCLLTYNTKFGLDRHHADQVKSETMSNEELIQWFRSQPDYKELFE